MAGLAESVPTRRRPALRHQRPGQGRPSWFDRGMELSAIRAAARHGPARVCGAGGPCAGGATATPRPRWGRAGLGAAGGRYRGAGNVAIRFRGETPPLRRHQGWTSWSPARRLLLRQRSPRRSPWRWASGCSSPTAGSGSPGSARAARRLLPVYMACTTRRTSSAASRSHGGRSAADSARDGLLTPVTKPWSGPRGPGG